MKIKNIIIFVLIGISIIGVSAYYFSSTPSRFMWQVWRFNFEPNRDSAMVLLDCALLTKIADPSMILKLDVGQLEKEDIVSIRDIADLYSRNDNTQRSRWLNSLADNLGNHVSVPMKIGEPYSRDFMGELFLEELVLNQLIASGNLSEAMVQSREDPLLAAKMGNYLLETGQVQDATRFFQIALTLNDAPECVNRSRNYSLLATGTADYFMNKGQSTEAIRSYDVAIALKKFTLGDQSDKDKYCHRKRAETLYYLIVGYIKMGRTREGMEFFFKAEKFLCCLQKHCRSITKLLIDSGNYDIVFDLLKKDLCGTHETLLDLAEASIKNKKLILKNDQKQILVDIVMKHKKLTDDFKILQGGKKAQKSIKRSGTK